ncbi:MAG: DUF4214 domain-containing protein [Planctomycetia bacterium]|nr:DUF4214 domain-containing protein [Planctomycetia bacterium]
MSQAGHSYPSVRDTLETLETRWVPANVGSPNQNFVDQLYRDVLHRAPDPGSAGWVAALDGGAARSDIVDGILDSPEGLQNQVNDIYVRFLDRPADPGGLAFWTNFLGDEDNTNFDLAAQILASNEYYQTQGGGTDFGFMNAVYMDVLCRPIGVDEMEDRGDDFDDGHSDRVDIALSILESDEGLDTRDILSVRSFLRMDVSADQARDLVDGDDDSVFSRSLLSTPAYFNLSQMLTPADFATIPSCDDRPAQPIGGPAPVQPIII